MLNYLSSSSADPDNVHYRLPIFISYFLSLEISFDIVAGVSHGMEALLSRRFQRPSGAVRHLSHRHGTYPPIAALTYPIVGSSVP